jgi:pyruvate, orthophosphate dikinase
MHSIPDDWGTAVNVQAMVFGNMGNSSATGVAFTRDAATGENLFNGEYLINAQGEDVVAGIRTPQQITLEGSKRWAKLATYVSEEDRAAKYPSLEEAMPVVYKQLMITRKNSTATTAICRTSNSPCRMAGCGFCKPVTENVPVQPWLKLPWT